MTKPPASSLTSFSASSISGGSSPSGELALNIAVLRNSMRAAATPRVSAAAKTLLITPQTLGSIGP